MQIGTLDWKLLHEIIDDKSSVLVLSFKTLHCVSVIEFYTGSMGEA